MNPFPPLTQRERSGMIVLALGVLFFDVVHFPTVAHGMNVEAAESPVSVQRVVMTIPTPPSLKSAGVEKIVLENPYGQDLEVPITSPGPTPTVPGIGANRAQMGDITNTPSLADLGHGDSTALVRDGNDTRLVHVGDVVAGHRIVSISLKGGVAIDDGSVLPQGSNTDNASAAAAPAPSASAAAPAVLLLPPPPLVSVSKPMVSRSRYTIRAQQLQQVQGGGSQ